MGFSRLLSDPVEGPRNCIVKLILSASDALKLKSHSIIEVLRSAERSGTVSSVSHDALSC